MLMRPKVNFAPSLHHPPHPLSQSLIRVCILKQFYLGTARAFESFTISTYKLK